MTLVKFFLFLVAFSYALSFWNSFRYYKTLEASTNALAVRWLTIGFFSQGIILAGKWFVDELAPLTTLYEILSVLSLSLAFALLVGRLKTEVAVLNSLFLPFILFLSLAALTVSFGSVALMDGRLMTTSLACHIFLTFFGFSFFTLGFGVSVAFWIQEGQLKQRQIKSWSYRLPALEILDSLTVFYIAVGFSFWAAGLGLGVVQAFQVWNRIPFDDPKILGSFLVLIIYAFFFLLRWGLHMRGRKSMALVMLGYFLALFTFVGVRLFLTTRHTF